MEQKQAKNDQQATNAALAALAAAGNTFALGQLWEVNKSFIRRQLWQWYEKNKPVADNAGLSFEDLVQEKRSSMYAFVRTKKGGVRSSLTRPHAPAYRVHKFAF